MLSLQILLAFLFSVGVKTKTFVPQDYEEIKLDLQLNPVMVYCKMDESCVRYSDCGANNVLKDNTKCLPRIEEVSKKYFAKYFGSKLRKLLEKCDMFKQTCCKIPECVPTTTTVATTTEAINNIQGDSPANINKCGKGEACVKYTECDYDGFIKRDARVMNSLNVVEKRCNVYKKTCCTFPPPLDTKANFETCKEDEECVKYEDCSEDGIVLHGEATGTMKKMKLISKECDLGIKICCKAGIKGLPFVQDPDLVECKENEACVSYEHCGEDGILLLKGEGIHRPKSLGRMCNETIERCCQEPPYSLEYDYTYGDSDEDLYNLDYMH